VVGPEVGGGLEQLPVAPEGPGHRGTAELTERLVGVLGQLRAYRRDVRAGQRQAGEQRVQRRVVDLRGVELAVQPGRHAQLGQLGERRRGGAEGGRDILAGGGGSVCPARGVALRFLLSICAIKEHTALK